MRPTRGLSSNSAAYIFPRHPTEADRLDLQHYALHEALGVNYLAPVSMPNRVLDVGCGSGQWAYDLCSEYPLVRVTRPGGWIELVEVGFEVEPAGPATRRMVEMMQRIGRSLGLDTTGIVLRSLSEYLHRAGATDIQQRSVTLRIGEWGGTDRILPGFGFSSCGDEDLQCLPGKVRSPR